MASSCSFRQDSGWLGFCQSLRTTRLHERPQWACGCDAAEVVASAGTRVEAHDLVVAIEAVEA
jgi:hypothetical protein